MAGRTTALCVYLVGLLLVSGDGVAEYYVSHSGSDSDAGTTPLTAWQTIDKINSVTFSAGDSILFEGGSSYTGMVYFDSADAGTADSPITVGSYGGGRATIHGGDGGAFFAWNSAGCVITNLAFTGSGRTSNTGDGISFWNNLAGDVLLERVVIADVEVNGFGKWGVAIGGANDRSGYRDVHIEGAVVHGNGRGGIITYNGTTNLYVNEQVYIRDSIAYSNAGVVGFPGNTGNGIVVGCTSTGIIERCVAHDNGWLCDASEGPVGIWAYDSRYVTIQFNESYANRTGGGADGGGFDFDQNMAHSVIQYNYSHDNDGAGFLLAHGIDNHNFTNVTVRYNISENDGRKNGYGGIMVWGRVLSAEVHNNTVFMGAPPGGDPSVVLVVNWGIPASDVNALHFRNNILCTLDGVRLMNVSASQLAGAQDLLFQGNSYYSNGDPFKVEWGGTTYGDLSAWRDGTGQERIGAADTGYEVAPGLVSAGGGGTIGDATRLSTLSAYRLRVNAPMVDAGLDLSARFGVLPGPQDFYGNPLPQHGAYDIGAHEQPPAKGIIVKFR